MANAPVNPPPASVEYLKYTGPHVIREITEAQFVAAGVKGQRTVKWQNANAWMVRADAVTSEARELILAQPNLEMVEVDGATV